MFTDGTRKHRRKDMKKKRLIKTVKKTFFVFAIAALSLNTTIASFASSIQDVEGTISDLEKEKKELEEKIAKLETEKGNVTNYISKLDNELSELTKQIDELQGKVGDTEQLLSKTQEELEQAKQTQVEQYDTMKARIKYMYENGSDDYMQMMLTSTSITDLLNRAEYINKISQYDQKLYERFNETRVSIEDKEATIQENLKKLNVLNEKLELEKQGVNTLIDNKTKELAKYTSNISEANEEVKAFNEEIAKQEEIVEQLLEAERKRIEEEERKKREEEEKRKQEEEEKKQQEAAQGNNSGSSNSGNNNSGSSSGSDSSSNDNTNSKSMRWPLQISGRITSYFGPRNSPTAGASSYHKGIDIAAATGTTIVAVNAGSVASAGYSSSMGYYVMLYHGNSTYTVYMHCNTLKVKQGQTVTKGQPIATLGSTGISTGPHLHFGVSINGSYVDPLKYISQP